MTKTLKKWSQSKFHQISIKSTDNTTWCVCGTWRRKLLDIAMSCTLDVDGHEAALFNLQVTEVKNLQCV